MRISFEHITHRFTDESVLQDINLEIDRGEIVCIIGPSGSGKTTLLRIAAGLERVQSGRIMLNDLLLANSELHPPPEERSIGLVFQDHVLFPHKTVSENVGFGLRNVRNKERLHKIALGLESMRVVEVSDRYPQTLSGGQQQRVALVRALITEPSVMLLDEPFASVDVPLRKRLREDARKQLKANDTATLIVTHDPEEAMALADRVAVLVDGKLVQTGTPKELWHAPKHPFIAKTLSGLQTLRGKVQGARLKTAFGDLSLSLINGRDKLKENDRAEIGIRPEKVSLAPSESPCFVRDIRFFGQKYVVFIQGDRDTLELHFEKEPSISIGEKVKLNLASAQAQLLSIE